MVEEYNSIMINDVWDVVPRPVDRSVVGSRWIYKIKHAIHGSIYGLVRLHHVPIDVVDILTKALGKEKFVYFREKMGVV